MALNHATPPPSRPGGEPTPGGFAVGARVQVRDGFCGAWSGGFEIATATDRGYTLRRLSDRYVLPKTFHADVVCRAQ